MVDDEVGGACPAPPQNARRGRAPFATFAHWSPSLGATWAAPVWLTGWAGSNSMAHLLGKPGAASSKPCNSLLAKRGGALGLLVACFHLLFVSVRWRRWFSLVLVGFRVWVFSTLAAHSAVFARSRASSLDFVSFVGSRRRSWVFIGARWVFVGFRWLPSVSVGCRLRCQS